ncbi:DUF3427 domain-containing protein [Bifidobacterium samirii]|uniref:RNA helicase n=1 Tax=Bifidobacterium samirii TaxID=2306974 RepID=A0A430FG23_9BIFI|nr:DUF3427 domain-containing protein [Bifidobacterium samirii]RSX51678.1 RNA helicase [Bifidobacterium samirii]
MTAAMPMTAAITASSAIIPDDVADPTIPLDRPAASARTSVLEDLVAGFIQPNRETPGAYAPTLIANGDGNTMHAALSHELETSESFDMSVAFVNAGAVKALLQSFRNHRDAHENSAPSRIITSTKNYFNDPNTFRELLRLQDTTGVEVRIWGERDAIGDDSSADAPASRASAHATRQGHPFHPKGYVFARRMPDGTPYYDLYVGSSNLTMAALTTQREWNLKVSSMADGGLISQVRRELDSQIEHSAPLTDDWIRRYEEDFKRYAPPREEILAARDRQRIEPNAMQREALANLQALRDAGERRAIIVSATGTGKTYLAAFDVRACRPKRMLYVAQQQQILTAAMASFQRVLGCADDELGLYSGTSRQQDRRYVFATVQTLRQPGALDQFAADDFDYVLIDEAHHAGADSYQRILDHFDGAGFTLGMTATPERMDGVNVFALFGHNIAYEIRLQRALDEGMLCPFHYYGVAEYLGSGDGSGDADASGASPEDVRIDVRSGKSARAAKQLQYEIGQLASEERVRYIIDKLNEYGQPYQPVTGLVFCSRQEEARELSRLFNLQMNQQAERPYRTAAVTSTDEQGRAVSQERREEYIRRLERGELDYLFTVDLFNEGVDIPAVNQIVMLRNTESSIVFTQQLGRGLRKFPHKDSVVVIDFIGNYVNNFLIPIALYGNTGDRDRARKNLQRQSIGLSSISFDPIARERVLRSLDTVDWSDMKRLTEQYRQLRYELGRIPMLADVYRFDPSLPYTFASKGSNYLDFVISRERSLGSRGRASTAPEVNDRGGADQLEPISPVADGILKMATELMLPGLRPHEPLILALLCGFIGADADWRTADWDTAGRNGRRRRALSRSALMDAIRRAFPDADPSDRQFDSAIGVLDMTYFTEPNRRRFGGTPLIIVDDHPAGGADGADDADPAYRLADEFSTMLDANPTFRTFLADTIQVGLFNCRDLFAEARGKQRPFERAFLYEHKYTLSDVMRLCGWKRENTPQNVGGYALDRETGTMPIFVKYAASQYEDEFLSPQDMRYFSKNGRTPQSPEFRWIRENEGTPAWDDGHFIPLFVMRKHEEKDGRYYYVGHVTAVDNPQLTTKPDAKGQGTVKVTLSTLRLAQPIDPELFRHLVG